MSDLTEPPLRRPGRPRSTRVSHRSRLLQVARELLADPEKNSDLSLREVALRAGVTPALAHYYFSNREGLIAAVIAERAKPLVDDLIRATIVRAAQPVAALTFLMQRTTSLLVADNFLCRCLLRHEPAAQALRDRLRALVRELLQNAQRDGQLRDDLPAEYLCEALLGLCLFPFLERQDAAQNSGERISALTLQHVALLQDGIVARHRPRQDSGS